MSRRDAQRITDILQSCRRLRDIASRGRDEFYASDVLQDAACYRLTVIGEALNNLSEDFATQHPGLRIPQARGMCNRLTHEYYDIDVEVLWDTHRRHRRVRANPQRCDRAIQAPGAMEPSTGQRSPCVEPNTLHL